MIFGKFKASIFLKVAVFIAIPTLVIIYQISQYYGHQPPFPHCWISKVAQHYPQFVFFRIATIPGAALMMLGWFANHFYLCTLAHQGTFNIKKYHPQISVVIGLMGAMLLMGSTATIDSGKMNQKWHGQCASKFFVFTFIAQIYNTVICTILYNHKLAISKFNLYVKYGIILLLLFQLYLSSTAQQNSDLNKFLQWTLTATIISGFYSIAMDCAKYEFVSIFDKVEELK